MILAIALAPTVWLREDLPPRVETLALTYAPVALPDERRLAGQLGEFRLEKIWHLDSKHHGFGGFSALVPLADGRFMAFSDRGWQMAFSPPGEPEADPSLEPVLEQPQEVKANGDVEAATVDPETEKIWLGWESRNAISRLDADHRLERMEQLPQMADWGANSGPEAMTRLSDGRFVVLREGFSGLFEDRRHKALLFDDDPVLGGRGAEFIFAGPADYSPTDMAQLPDGRVLILMRKLVWPLPARFACLILIADPEAIKAGATWSGEVVARLSSALPVDNLEGLAITPGKADRATVWLISDDNGAAFQRTLLWKLSVDLARLPQASKKARDHGRTP